ncbi:hypothetical protein CH339_18255 [Rhodobium orientis]|uniref:Uncharacterized protein n=1 Tax=Rhodobium orientis TaxID=34017 RepID=A0A327JI60_9HYPH|nr:hypothetical protein [Rhodobium orientis]RAI25396.1 hypothetical protein CH339_18255 [Rhodobium orientis]
MMMLEVVAPRSPAALLAAGATASPLMSPGVLGLADDDDIAPIRHTVATRQARAHLPMRIMLLLPIL